MILRVVGYRFLLLVAWMVSGLSAAGGQGEDRAGWMREARWGVMVHYLADWKARESGEPMTVERWNALIDAFDVEALAEQLESLHAGYLLISIGQNSGYYLAPNEAYDRLTGLAPSKCSRRDLVADLHAALRRRGVRLMVYLPSGAPNQDEAARTALEWTNGPHRNGEFQLKWEEVIREWSLRWGDRVSGWWFDGCYWPNAMYRQPEPPNFASFAAAARAGNPDAVLAFAPGITYRVISWAPEEDFTAGEVDRPELFGARRVFDGKVDGAQLHMLSYLGQRWGSGTPRFNVEDVGNWSRAVAALGGVVTWDVPVSLDGKIPDVFLAQLRAVDRVLKP